MDIKVERKKKLEMSKLFNKSTINIGTKKCTKYNN